MYVHAVTPTSRVSSAVQPGCCCNLPVIWALHTYITLLGYLSWRLHSCQSSSCLVALHDLNCSLIFVYLPAPLCLYFVLFFSHPFHPWVSLWDHAIPYPVLSSCCFSPYTASADIDQTSLFDVIMIIHTTAAVTVHLLWSLSIHLSLLPSTHFYISS